MANKKIKMKNRETGETIEVSCDEILKSLREGNATLQQQVKHLDGTVTTHSLYGNEIGDGIDRSLNVFGTLEDIFHIGVKAAQQLQEKGKNNKNIFYMDDCDVNYEVTIDDTTNPIMHIVTCTKEKVKIARYIRDERKSVDNILSSVEKVFKNGTITATLEEIEKENLVLWAFSIYQLRKLLHKSGILQKLQTMKNKASGVVVTVNGEEIKTEIVCGHARPDLPCLMFGGLFSQDVDDAIMMRPYFDEFLNI